jgi:hypothetical protein
MARPWDTKKKFEPDYRGVARLVFLGWLRALGDPNYRSIASELADVIWRIGEALLGIALGVLLLITSPLSFPLICVIHKRSLRAKRLRYLKQNRRADELAG